MMFSESVVLWHALYEYFASTLLTFPNPTVHEDWNYLSSAPASDSPLRSRRC